MQARELPVNQGEHAFRICRDLVDQEPHLLRPDSELVPVAVLQPEQQLVLGEPRQARQAESRGGIGTARPLRTGYAMRQWLVRAELAAHLPAGGAPGPGAVDHDAAAGA